VSHMGALLHRIGGFAVRRRWSVVIAWLAILIAVGICGAAFSGPTSNAFRIPGTESQQALDLLDQKFPGTGGADARVVVAAPAGHTLAEQRYRLVAQRAIAEVARAPQVIGVTPLAQATVSKDQRIAFVDVHYAVPVDEVSSQAKAALESIATQVRASGLEVEFSGGVISTTTPQGNNDLYGIIIAFVVLTITFGALVSAGMPLLTALIGVGVGLLGISALSGLISLSSTAPTLALMLGLAVGMDYTLFILSRHRQNLADGMGVEQSIALATATAGGAVVFAGLTVVIALAGLAVMGIPFLTVMGLAAAATVALVVLIAVTFVPAALAVLGTRVNAGRIPALAHRADKRAGRPGFGRRWAAIVTAKPWLTVLACIVGVAVLSIPILSIQLGLPDDSSKPTSTTERRAYDLLTQGFGAGFNGPLTLVVYAPGHTDVAKIAAQAATALNSAPDVAEVGQPLPNKAGDVAILQVIPKSSPASETTKTLVTDIRAAAAKIRSQSGISAYVTGTTASNIDVSNKLGSALPIFLVLIVGLALILLMIVFRSLLVPIKAVVGFLVSIGASLGITVFVFQEGHLGSLLNVETPAPVVSFLPVLLVGILFGLAMDYEVFLVSRVREDYVYHHDPDRAITAGMANSARVVTAAGLIMISVFGSFIFGDNAVIKSIGFALAVGVAIDAFVVRMTFVPAVLKLLGHAAWALPGWLDRILPDLDLEGTRLEASHAHAPSSAHVGNAQSRS
jgi:putative drug exporter of the RND superfamily